MCGIAQGDGNASQLIVLKDKSELNIPVLSRCEERFCISATRDAPFVSATLSNVE
jgi:hypothetical protein